MVKAQVNMSIKMLITRKGSHFVFSWRNLSDEDSTHRNVIKCDWYNTRARTHTHAHKNLKRNLYLKNK